MSTMVPIIPSASVDVSSGGGQSHGVIIVVVVFHRHGAVVHVVVVHDCRRTKQAHRFSVSELQFP